ncbi:RNA-directed DNA polymerase, eukaryota, partial [Tanacetum coccineum]
MEDTPTMVLDETCLNKEDFSLCLLRKVKDFASLSNLKVVLIKEGYENLELKYMGGFWVMIAFQDDETKYKFHTNLGVPGWVPDFEEDSDGDSSDGDPEDEEKSCKYPPGFTPDVKGDASVKGIDIVVQETQNKYDQEDGGQLRQVGVAPRTGGSIIQFIDDLLKVGQTMGYDMTGCMENMEKIIESQGVNEGNSGGILCIWDPNMFQKRNETVLDYFTMVRGTWVPSGISLLIISVYAPQELSEKKMLWDYLSVVMTNWNGEVVMMGDFNEVRDSSERFGSVFNKHGAEAFNNFIANAGLVEVSLGGCSFTWCHKSATKMSKLDRFLISDNLMCSSPTISSISLDRFLSDHRPILMRESHHDYGPTPFKFFQYWCGIEGFDKLVEDSWNEAQFTTHNPYVCGKRNLKHDLTKLDAIIDKGNETIDTINRRQEVVRLIQDLEKIDTLEAAQKAKIKWSIEGDENSKYYDGVLNKKKKSASYKGFEHTDQSGIRLKRDFGKTITVEQKEFLESEVSKEEIKRAVWDCGIDKALGPNGFTFGFYRQYWSIIENDVVEAVQWFFLKGEIPKGVLFGSCIKIIAKILSNRLVSVIGKLVNEIQSAFVADRQILDGLFILNELIQWCKKRKMQNLVSKIDFEKAYDSVRWDFVGEILQKFGFGKKWCKWIQSCPHSSRGSVLVNGSPTQEFQFHKGLKQGDPLSPFLFIMVMESLHISFQRVVDAGLFKGIKVAHAGDKIGCMVLNTPFKYLGSRVGDVMSQTQSWSEVIGSMVSRLSRWKLKTLSIGGRLTLLKFVLGAIPIYHMSLFKVPMKVLHNMEAIKARFFNGMDINSRKLSWVRWKNVMASKEVIKALHGNGGKIGMKSKASYPSLWISIIQETESLKSRGIDLLRFITPVLGNGVNTSFWDVPWRGEVAFKELVPRLYALETQKDIKVASKLSHGGLEESFRRVPRGGVEQAQLEILKENMEGCILNSSNDRWSWSLDGSGEFSVSSVRKAIDDSLLPHGTTKTRWIKTVPIKINIHAWKVKNDCLPT